MNTRRLLHRVGAPAAAFALAASGALLLVNGGEAAPADPGIPTVIAVTVVDAGTPTGDLVDMAEIRLVPPDVRVQGAVASLDELPAGVLTTGLVPGQQILVSTVGQLVSGSGEGLIAVSVRLDPQRWVGPYTVSGTTVDVYAVGSEVTEVVAQEAVVLEAVDPTTLTATQDTIVTLGVNPDDVAGVIAAVAGTGIWLVTS